MVKVNKVSDKEVPAYVLGMLTQYFLNKRA